MYKQWAQTQDKKTSENKLKSDFEMHFQKLKDSGESEEIE